MAARTAVSSLLDDLQATAALPASSDDDLAEPPGSETIKIGDQRAPALEELPFEWAELEELGRVGLSDPELHPSEFAQGLAYMLPYEDYQDLLDLHALVGSFIALPGPR